MTFQVHRPHPAGQCFGPKCAAAAREKDRSLIPRFCSDPCKARFVDEHALHTPTRPVIEPAPAPLVVIDEIHTHTDADLEPVRAAVAARTNQPTPFARVYLNDPVIPTDTAEVQRRLAEFAAALAPVFKEIGLVLQRAVAAVRPAIEQLHAFARNTPPTDPKARALWLRHNRNTGPAAKPHRAPRFLDTSSSRRTR